MLLYNQEATVGRTIHNLDGILEELRRETDKHDGSVSVGDLVDALDEQGYGAALAILRLIN